MKNLILGTFLGLFVLCPMAQAEVELELRLHGQTKQRNSLEIVFDLKKQKVQSIRLYNLVRVPTEIQTGQIFALHTIGEHYRITGQVVQRGQEWYLKINKFRYPNPMTKIEWSLVPLRIDAKTGHAGIYGGRAIVTEIDGKMDLSSSIRIE